VNNLEILKEVSKYAMNENNHNYILVDSGALITEILNFEFVNELMKIFN
jgi:hypothetical protein